MPVYADGRPYTGLTGGDVNESSTADAEQEAPPRPRREVGFSDGSAEFESLLLFYVPGGGFQQFRPGMAKRVRKEDHLTWGVHYSPTGVPETDRHRLGVWFQQGVITHKVVTAAVTGNHIVEGDEVGSARNRPVIPPRAENWRITGITAFRDAVTLTGLWPHMHLRGKDMTFIVTYPDGREQTILSVPNYDFNWQLQYEFEEPLRLPAGSTIKAVAHYDNSVRNHYNPAPDREVYWSEQSWDEMFLPFLELTVDKRDLSQGKPATN